LVRLFPLTCHLWVIVNSHHSSSLWLDLKFLCCRWLEYRYEIWLGVIWRKPMPYAPVTLTLRSSGESGSGKLF
jgi:hypothetical protein